MIGVIRLYRAFSLRWKPLVISLLLALGTGLLSAWNTGDSVDAYKTLILPPLAPPSIVFPVVWIILYVLMGLSAYLIFLSKSDRRQSALTIYVIQLIFNALWSPIFFRLEAFLFAFVWLVVLWGLVAMMIGRFTVINKTAARLQLPYLLWLTFAGYLNLAIYLLN